MNIVLLIIDTLRYDYLGAHGNDWIQTPNLDRFAAESWVFHNSYCSSYPTIPHRTDVMTGNYGGPLHAWMPLPMSEPTLPDTLARLGYCTQFIHDTPHLVNGGHAFDYPFHAWTFVRGAEVDRPVVHDTLRMPEHWACDPLFDEQPKPPPSVPATPSNLNTYMMANANRQRDEDWNCAKLFLTAREFLRQNAKRDNFFLWLDCFDPHEPWDVPPEFVRKYDQTPGYDGRVDPRTFGLWRNQDVSPAANRRLRAYYAAKVSWVDRWFGEFLQGLEETGLKDHTAVLVTADHGTNDGRVSGRGFGKKWDVQEGEAHTPFILHVPGVGAGSSAMIVQPQDVYSTLLGLAGSSAPANLDSHDVLALAQAGKSGPRELAIAGGPPGAGDAPFSVFDGEWSLHVRAKLEDCVLRKMGAPDEVVTEQHPDVVQNLRARGIAEYERRGGDPGVVHWLRAEGSVPFPSRFNPHRFGRRPAGYESYFSRLYHGQFEMGER